MRLPGAVANGRTAGLDRQVDHALLDGVDGYYLAECPHGRWSVWDAKAIVGAGV